MKATGHDWGNLALLLFALVAVVFCAFASVNAEWDVAIADVGLASALLYWLAARVKG